MVLARTFDAEVRPRVEQLALAPSAAIDIQRELTKMAGADVSRLTSIPPPERTIVRTIIDQGFVFAFRLVMIGAAGLALAAAVVGHRIRQESSTS